MPVRHFILLPGLARESIATFPQVTKSFLFFSLKALRAHFWAFHHQAQQKLNLSSFRQRSSAFWHQEPVSWQSFPMDWGRRGGGLGMIQTHYVYCALHLHYYYSSCASDHQAVGPEGCGPRLRVMTVPCKFHAHISQQQNPGAEAIFV